LSLTTGDSEDLHWKRNKRTTPVVSNLGAVVVAWHRCLPLAIPSPDPLVPRPTDAPETKAVISHRTTETAKQISRVPHNTPLSILPAGALVCPLHPIHGH
jgi:hypothetical protein